MNLAGPEKSLLLARRAGQAQASSQITVHRYQQIRLSDGGVHMVKLRLQRTQVKKMKLDWPDSVSERTVQPQHPDCMWAHHRPTQESLPLCYWHLQVIQETYARCAHYLAGQTSSWTRAQNEEFLGEA